MLELYMGWISFAVGRMSRRPKKNDDGFEHFMLILTWSFFRYANSFKNKVVNKTVLQHPQIRQKCDLEEWEKDLHKRAFKAWLFLILLVIGSTALCIIFGAYNFVFFTPTLWYIGKSHVVRLAHKQINRDFQDMGYDVKKLLAEIPPYFEQQKLKQTADDEQQLIADEKEKHRKKFGLA